MIDNPFGGRIKKSPRPVKTVVSLTIKHNAPKWSAAGGNALMPPHLGVFVVV